jgi:hypothetical protein
MTLDIVLLKGPRRGVFLMSGVPLYIAGACWERYLQKRGAVECGAGTLSRVWG